jgi:DNA-binding Xre family transcriptional regulator
MSSRCDLPDSSDEILKGASSKFSKIFSMSEIYWRVEELATQRGWGARQLAEETGLDQKTVRNILAGRATRVDLNTIAQLSRALGVGPGSLWDVGPDSIGAWERTAGAAGEAGPGELDEVLSGRWPEPDPALERALREP